MIHMVTCNQCGYSWTPFKENPRYCTNCASKYWNNPKIIPISCQKCGYSWRPHIDSGKTICPHCHTINRNKAQQPQLIVPTYFNKNVEPKIGDIAGSRIIGKIRKGFYQWSACMDCHEPRWVLIFKNKLRNSRCKKCQEILLRKQAPIFNLGDKNGQWKGTSVTYGALHDYVKSHKPKPELCECCHKSRPYDLANISGKYLRDLNDWEWLCRKCHMTKDGRIAKLINYEKHRSY